MLEMKDILKYYPENLRHFKRQILREYLQYLILKEIYTSDYSDKLSFISGTALHICHDIKRFSEDLDFDNFGLKKDEFKKLVNKVVKRLELYDIEVSFSFTDAFRAKLKFRNILNRFGLLGHKEEKLVIIVDTTRQDYKVKPKTFLLNKFGVYQHIFVNPAPIIMSQKLVALLKRNRVMGRDCYDISFLSGFTQPDEDYLERKIGLRLEKTKEKIRERLSKENMKSLSEDVKPFLYEPGGEARVLNFLADLDSLF